MWKKTLKLFEILRVFYILFLFSLKQLAIRSGLRALRSSLEPFEPDKNGFEPSSLRASPQFQGKLLVQTFIRRKFGQLWVFSEATLPQKQQRKNLQIEPARPSFSPSSHFKNLTRPDPAFSWLVSSLIVFAVYSKTAFFYSASSEHATYDESKRFCQWPCVFLSATYAVVQKESQIIHRQKRKKQEQTKFYDLRRGITEDFQRLAKFNQKAQKRFTNFKRFAFFTFFDL